MPDLGSIGTKGLTTKGGAGHGLRHYYRCIVCGPTRHDVLVADAAKSTGEGTPSQPSLYLAHAGVFRFRWVVASGTRTISVSVKQSQNVSPRPKLVVKANTAIGVNSDVESVAGSGTGWVTIGPATINPTSLGVVWVELHGRYDGVLVPCYFDNVVVT